MQHFALGHMAISLSQLSLKPLNQLLLLTASHVYCILFGSYFFEIELTGIISFPLKHRLQDICTDLWALDCYLCLSSISLATTECGRKNTFNFHFRFFGINNL